MWADIKELAGSVSEGVQEAGRLLTDTEFLGDFVEGATDTVVKTSDYLVNKMTLDDVKEAAGKVVDAVETLVDHAIEHPVDTLVEMRRWVTSNAALTRTNRWVNGWCAWVRPTMVDLASMASTGGASKGAKVGGNRFSLRKQTTSWMLREWLTRSAMQRTVRQLEESKRERDVLGYANSVKCSRAGGSLNGERATGWPMRFHGPMSR